MRRSHGYLLAVATGVIALLLVRPWCDAHLTAEVTVTTDTRGVVMRQRLTRLVATWRAPRPALSAVLDLRRLASEPVRIDVRGDLRSRWTDTSLGKPGSVLERETKAGPEPVPFVGWRGEAGRKGQVAELGCYASIRRDPSGRPWAWRDDGHFWVALRPPADSPVRLLISATPAGLSDPAPPAPPAPAPTTAVPGPGPDRSPDVFIYLIDALRADHLGCYGYPRPTSPAIDAFAKHATRYDQAYATASWTKPAVGSILTGLGPRAHGAVSDWDGLPSWTQLITELLPAGYHSFAITTNGYISEPHGFGQGFERFEYSALEPAPGINIRAEALLRTVAAASPVFLYLHGVDCHAPYAPTGGGRARFDRRLGGRFDGSLASLDEARRLGGKLSAVDKGKLEDLYDAEIREVDQAFGDFLGLLRRAGRYDDAVIILMADHGEAFGEHRTIAHRGGLHVEETRIPLLIRYPRGHLAGRRVGVPVSAQEIITTLLPLTGARHPTGYPLDGRDLSRLVDSRDRVPVFSHLYTREPEWESLAVLDEDGYRGILSLVGDPARAGSPTLSGLWHTKMDPWERTNLLRIRPVRAAYDEQLLATWLARQDAARPPGATPAPIQAPHSLRENLKALGYVQ